MIKILLTFLLFFVVIWFTTELVKKTTESKIFYRITVKISGILLLTMVAILGLIWLF